MRTDRIALLASAALVFNALVYGLAWMPFRYLDARGLHGLWATVIVYLLCAAAVVLWRPSTLSRALRRPRLWLLMAAAGITNAAFNWGVVVGEVVRVVLLFYLMPVWSALFARLLLGEAITPAIVARMALALAGAAIVLAPEAGGLPLPGSLGDWLGVIGGMGFALANVLIRRESGEPEGARLLSLFLGGIAVPGLLAVLLSASGSPLVAWPPSPQADWIAGVLVLAGAFLIGNVALQFGASRLAASVTALLLLTEVVFAAVSAVLIGGESLTQAKLAGGAMIVAAALLAARGERAAGH